MDGEVLGGSNQRKGVIPEVAQASIATVAQQGPDLASDVIVVDGQLLQSAPESGLGCGATNRTLTFLSFEHRLVILRRAPIIDHPHRRQAALAVAVVIPLLSLSLFVAVRRNRIEIAEVLAEFV